MVCTKEYSAKVKKKHPNNNNNGIVTVPILGWITDKATIRVANKELWRKISIQVILGTLNWI